MHMLFWRFNILVLALFVLETIAPCGFSQEFMLGGLAPREDQKSLPPNTPIKTEWSEKTDNWSIRLGPSAKSRWGSAESPTFLLQVRNDSKESRKIEIGENDLQIDINGQVYQWDSPGTRLVTKLNAGEIRENLFIIRLDRSQWKPVDPKSSSESKRLMALSEGSKAIEVRLTLRDGGNKPQLIKSRKTDVVITKAAFEMPTVAAVLLGHDGKPVKGADIYLCRDAQFSVFYSGYDGKWFKTKSISHYDPFRSGFVQQAKPIKTNDKGEFTLSPSFKDKRIVVLPPIGSAQVFEIPKSFDNWKVQLKETGSLVVEQDIDGETGTANASVYSSRQLTNVKSPNNTAYMLTESFNIPLENGKKYKIENLVPSAFRLNRYKYVRVGNRSYSIGRRNHLFNIEAGKKTEFRMVRKTGQKISMSATHVPENMQYVVAGVFELDEVINLKSVYSNTTLWADASVENGKKIKFKSALISPGKYRLVIMSVPKGKKPNQSTYKPDHVGSKVIEVGDSGEIDAGDIRMFPVDVWTHNSGMALILKIVKFPGLESAGSQAIWPVNIGYGQGFDALEIRTTPKGEANALRPPGKYRFAVGLDSNQATLFEVQVPRMTPKEIVIADKRDWATDSSKKPELVMTAGFDSKSDRVKVEIENKGKLAFTPKFGDIQLWVQSTAGNVSSGVRFMPPPESTSYSQVIKPGTKSSFDLDMKDLIGNALCTSTRLTAAKLKDYKGERSKGMVLAVLRLGPTMTKPFQVRELPTLKPKPFR